jgi:hypothetical protein
MHKVSTHLHLPSVLANSVSVRNIGPVVTVDVNTTCGVQCEGGRWSRNCFAPDLASRAPPRGRGGMQSVTEISCIQLLPVWGCGTHTTLRRNEVIVGGEGNPSA